MRISLIAGAVASLLAVSTANAQSANSSAAASSVTPESVGCTYSFGSGNLQWCVNAHGNLQKFMSPSGQEHIAVGMVQEGYIVCVDSDVATYHDDAVSEAGWGAPVLVAQTASSVTIDRVTSDGRFKLTQKWTKDTTERDLTVQMTLQNLGPAAYVKLARSADIDANNDSSDDRYDKSRYGVWVRDIDGVAMEGLTLSPAPKSVVINSLILPPKCNYESDPIPGGPGDPKLYIYYTLGTMNNGAKKTVKVGYRAQ